MSREILHKTLVDIVKQYGAEDYGDYGVCAGVLTGDPNFPAIEFMADSSHPSGIVEASDCRIVYQQMSEDGAPGEEHPYRLFRAVGLHPTAIRMLPQTIDPDNMSELTEAYFCCIELYTHFYKNLKWEVVVTTGNANIVWAGDRPKIVTCGIHKPFILDTKKEAEAVQSLLEDDPENFEHTLMVNRVAPEFYEVGVGNYVGDNPLDSLEPEEPFFFLPARDGLMLSILRYYIQRGGTDYPEGYEFYVDLAKRVVKWRQDNERHSFVQEAKGVTNKNITSLDANAAELMAIQALEGRVKERGGA